MNPYKKYEQYESVGWTRVDMVLALVDGLVSRLEGAEESVGRGDTRQTIDKLFQAEQILAGLLDGLNLNHGDLPYNLLRLYEFVFHQIETAQELMRSADELNDQEKTQTVESLQAALKVLRLLREAYQEIRPITVQMERNGELPSCDLLHRTQLRV